jgi:tRNA A-37 threonylcarbamoyl transferase component Bud32
MSFLSVFRKQSHEVASSPGDLQGELSALIAAHDAALGSGKGVLKDGPRTAVTRVRYGLGWLCVKEYRPHGLLDRIKDALRGSRARRALRGANKLHAHGIATPEIVALAGRDGKSYLFTSFINGATPLDLLLRKRFSAAQGQAEVADKRTMVRKLGRWLRRVHDLGIYHDDWSTKNILVTQRGQEWTFHFVDMESVSSRKRLTYRRRVKNLGQISDTRFGITRTDRMRFLLAYAGDDASLTRGSFPRDVLKATQRRYEEYQKVRAKARKQKARLKRKMAKASHITLQGSKHLAERRKR